VLDDRASLTARFVAGRRFGLLDWGRTPIGARTRFVDDEVMRAIGAGVSQVVIVAAGYDGRPLRFNAPGLRWIEVDHPATQRDKRRRLEALGIPLDHVTFVAIDLAAGSLDQALDGAGQRTDRPTLWICEGLFGYLERDITVELCRTLRRRSAPGTVLCATFLVLDAERSTAARWTHSVFHEAIAMMGERHLTEFRSGDADEILGSAGWSAPVRQMTSHQPGRGAGLLAVAVA
jgi:methyltransferase (TIGR00027 family)